MEDRKMLQTVINGQSAMKAEILGEIKNLHTKLNNLEEKVGNGFEKVNQRLDLQGKQLAELDDDSPTLREYVKLEKRVSRLEKKASLVS